MLLVEICRFGQKYDENSSGGYESFLKIALVKIYYRETFLVMREAGKGEKGATVDWRLIKSATVAVYINRGRGSAHGRA